MKDAPGVSLVTSAASYACKYFSKITVNTAWVGGILFTSLWI